MTKCKICDKEIGIGEMAIKDGKGYSHLDCYDDKFSPEFNEELYKKIKVIEKEK